MKDTFKRIKKEEARDAAIAEYRKEIDSNTLTANIVFVTLAENGTIDEVTATEHTNVFAQWEPNIAYNVGNLRVYEDKLYKCVQAHTSQADWIPAATASLWAIAGDPAEEWPQWSQPIGAHDVYMKDDKVTYNDKHWVSTVDNNSWAPGIYGW